MDDLNVRWMLKQRCIETGNVSRMYKPAMTISGHTANMTKASFQPKINATAKPPTRVATACNVLPTLSPIPL